MNKIISNIKPIIGSIFIIMVFSLSLGFYLWYELPISKTSYESYVVVVDKYKTFPKHNVYHIVFEDNNGRGKFTIDRASWESINIGDKIHVHYDRFEYKHDNIGYKVYNYTLQ